MATSLVMLLAGGRGSRLNILAAHRAKPAVPFAGMYRIIDFALSNCMHAKLHQGGVLTQYHPSSLMNHVEDGQHWNFSGRDGFLKILPPYQGVDDLDWYRGTADAVYQNLDFIWRYKADRIVVLSGDHIYRMDYRAFLNHHEKTNADVTIATMPVPIEEASRFGIIVTDGKGQITGFQEKPENPSSNLASMGIYIFQTEALFEELEALPRSETDFGANVIPRMVEKGRNMQAYEFDGYWRDVGTIDSYFETNLDVLRPDSGIRLADWKVRTNLSYESVQAMPPARIDPGAVVVDSLISPGCHIKGRVERSILSPGVLVEAGAQVVDSIVMHRSKIRSGATVIRSIIDKHVDIGSDAVVGSRDNGHPNKAYPEHLMSGLVVVGKKSIVPASVTLGPNVIVAPEATEEMYSGNIIDAGEMIE